MTLTSQPCATSDCDAFFFGRQYDRTHRRILVDTTNHVRMTGIGHIRYLLNATFFENLEYLFLPSGCGCEYFTHVSQIL